MQLDLSLLDYTDRLRIKTDTGGKRYVFGRVRKRWLVLQPEEWVRQLLIHHLIETAGYPAATLAVERSLKLPGDLPRRFDLLVHDRQGKPWLLVECKAPEVEVRQAVFRQAAQYNLTLKVPYLVVTNGRHTYCCAMNHEAENWSFMSDLPAY
ncbi:MAG: type I restriction enzyme HsdR N-terminal domain-containing protein [Saprospiraceae bacterium]